MMSERFTWKTEKLQHFDDEVIMVVDNANKDWKGHILNIVDMLNELNDERMMYKTTIDKRIVELEEENEQLRKYNGQLKERLERINGGYGHLTYHNGLTANEWLIESQEREIKKKNEQISDLKEENERLKQQIKIEKKWQLEKDRYYVDLHKKYDKLEKENDELKKQVEDCRDYNAILYKNCIQKDKRWLKRIKRVEDELEEYIKENARLREMYNDD